MYRIIFPLLLFFVACTLPEKEKENSISKKSDTTVIETYDTNTAALDTSNSIALPVVQKIKSPSGIYQIVLPLKTSVQQTIAFNTDLTYQLQEKYIGKEKDSIVISEGTWAPSDGFIWLYKDQVARGRYRWKGNTLQYYNPSLRKGFSMRHLQDAMQNISWKNKGKKGIILFGTGNEPFWNIELDNKDSISFLLPEWGHPLKLKIDSSFNNKDSSGFFAKRDSTEIHVTVFPQFCSDGMSDFIYRNKIQVQYNRRLYNGCGIVYQ